MDVRCDRCQTEYELDDESVAGVGASVQCTTCGHTFVVSRAGSVNFGTTPSGALGGAETPAPSDRASQRITAVPTPAPAAPEWVLATEEGPTHRLRDLTTLQKWVVERRVSRDDRVSHRGGAWLKLADIEELRPFFDVVAEADRQTGARAVEPAPSLRPTVPAAARKVQTAVRTHMSPDLDDDDVLSSASSHGRRSRPDADRFMDLDIGSDDDLSSAFKPRRTGLKVLGGLLIVGLAAGAWYVGFRDTHGFHLATGGAAPPSAPAAAPASAPAAPASAPAAAPPVEPVPPAAIPITAQQGPAPGVAPPITGSPPPSASPPSPASVALPVPAPAAAIPAPLPPPAPAVAAKRVPAPAPAGAAPPAGAPPGDTRPRTYERLVGDADNALENGQTTKAQKLYDDALRLQPNGVGALTGAAYVLMDKRRPLAAIGLFKQVLSNAPHFAPALFGLGEAYRGQGDNAQAIEAYKHYLEQSPTGPDAPAARRQIKELSDAGPPSRTQGPAAVVPETARTEGSPTAPPSAN